MLTHSAISSSSPPSILNSSLHFFMWDHHSYTKPFSFSMIVKSFSTLLEYNKSLIFILDLPLFSFIRFSLSSFLSSHSFYSPFSVCILLPLVTFTFFLFLLLFFLFIFLCIWTTDSMSIKKNKNTSLQHLYLAHISALYQSFLIFPPTVFYFYLLLLVFQTGDYERVKSWLELVRVLRARLLRVRNHSVGENNWT